MILNLDAEFQPFDLGLPLIAFETFVFPGGEPHLKIRSDLDPAHPVHISHRIRTFGDLGLLCLAVDTLRRMGVSQITLFLPYFPGARQDRVMVPGEPLTVKVYADLINALQLDRVTVFDPHSEVTPALLNRCTVLDNQAFIRQVLTRIGGEVLLVSPDGGALKKIYKLSEALGGLEVVECSKSRDVKTGRLSGFKVYADELKGRSCLIVDDICDGGGTFIGLAEVLRAKGAGRLYLAVSHGIFSRGLSELSACFDGIFTTDSFRNLDSESGVIQLKLSTLFQKRFGKANYDLPCEHQLVKNLIRIAELPDSCRDKHICVNNHSPILHDDVFLLLR
jgi:ribose-phosphate pyrophosphokinase